MNTVSQVNGEVRFGTHLHLPASWGGEGSTEEQWCLPVLPSLGRAVLTRPSSHHPEASQFSSSPYVPDTFQAAAPALEPRGNECVNESLHWSLKRIAGPLHLTWTQSPLIFTVRCSGDSFTWYWCLGLGSWVWGRTPCPSEEPLQLR